MAEEDTPAAPALDYSQLPALLEKLGLTPPSPPQQSGQQGQGGVAGFLGDVGKALAGGGSGLLDLPPGESDKAGAHALLNAGINMLMASGPSYVPRGLGQIIGYGLQGAQEGYQGSELATAQRLAAQQAGQQQQFTNRMEAIKAALPLLQMQMRANLPNPFAQGGGKSGSISGYIDPVTQMPREQALDALAQRESGNKNVPNAEGGDASGYWQIRDATWRDGAKLAGVDVSKYPRAIDAPQAVQRQVAGALYDRDGAAPWAASAPGRPTQTASTATPPPAAPKAAAAPPGVQMGGEPPAPPGGSGAAYTGGVGAALQPPKDTPVLTVDQPPPAPKVGPIPVGKLLPKTADNVGAIVAGMEGARTGPAPPTALAAGPAAPTAPAPDAGWGTTVGTYGAGATAPAATPTQPAGAAQPPAPTPAPGQPRDITNLKDEELSPPEFQTRYRTPLPPDLGVVKVPDAVNANLQGAVTAAQQEAASAAAAMKAAEQNWRMTGSDKSLQARDAAQARSEAAQTTLQSAQQAATKAQQDADTTTAANRVGMQKAQDEQLAAAYKDMKDRQAAVALKTQEGQQQETIEKIKAGQTFHMQQEEEAAKQTNTNTIAPMSAAAAKAHQINLGLSQLQTVLPNLPAGGGLVGSLLDNHPDIGPLLRTAGVITDRQADAVQLLKGLTASISTEMKPVGLGALREYEFDAFKAQLPGLLSSRDGQGKALAYLMNLNNRIQQEAQWTQQQYNRRIPDEMSQKPGATRRALNLDTDGGEPWQQKMDRELGPLVPSFTPPEGAARPGDAQAAWEASLPPGKPFFRTYKDGSTSLEYKPWR